MMMLLLEKDEVVEAGHLQGQGQGHGQGRESVVVVVVVVVVVDSTLLDTRFVARKRLDMLRTTIETDIVVEVEI